LITRLNCAAPSGKLPSPTTAKLGRGVSRAADEAVTPAVATAVARKSLLLARQRVLLRRSAEDDEGANATTVDAEDRAARRATKVEQLFILAIKLFYLIINIQYIPGCSYVLFFYAHSPHLLISLPLTFWWKVQKIILARDPAAKDTNHDPPLYYAYPL
jgi:hypothetical protein